MKIAILTTPLLAAITIIPSMSCYAGDAPVAPPLTPQEAARSGWVPVTSTNKDPEFPQAPGVQNYNNQEEIPYNTAPTGAQNQNNGMPPLPPPSLLEETKSSISPLNPDQIRQAKSYYYETGKASSSSIIPVPRVRSTSLKLSGQNSVVEVQTLFGQVSAVSFYDSTGAPWPLADSPWGAKDTFDAYWPKDSNTVMFTPQTLYGTGSFSVMLVGLPVPIPVQISTLSQNKKLGDKQLYDARHEVRVPGRGPNAKQPTVGDDQIALYDPVLQDFLDGVPPSGAQLVNISPKNIQVEAWKYQGQLFVKTNLSFRTAFDRTISSGNGTSVYVLPVTPFIALSSDAKAINIELDI